MSDLVIGASLRGLPVIAPAGYDVGKPLPSSPPSWQTRPSMRRVLLLAFVWGWSFVFIKIAGRGFNATTVAAGRVACGLITLLIVGRLSRVRMPRDRRFWWNATLSGVLGAALPFTLLAWAEQHISSALTSVAQATTTIFAAIASAIVMRDRLRVSQVVGLGVGIVGVAIASGLDFGEVGSASALGVLAAIVAGLWYALNYVHIQRNLIQVPPIVAATGQLAMATIVLAPIALVTSIFSGTHATPGRIGAVLELGVVATGIAYWINYGTIGRLGATRAALTTYLIPPVAIVVGWLVLNERVDLRLVVGTAIIIGGVAAVHGGRHTMPSPAVEARSR